MLSHELKTEQSKQDGGKVRWREGRMEDGSIITFLESHVGTILNLFKSNEKLRLNNK